MASITQLFGEYMPASVADRIALISLVLSSCAFMISILSATFAGSQARSAKKNHSRITLGEHREQVRAARQIGDSVLNDTKIAKDAIRGLAKDNAYPIADQLNAAVLAQSLVDVGSVASVKFDPDEVRALQDLITTERAVSKSLQKLKDFNPRGPAPAKDAAVAEAEKAVDRFNSFYLPIVNMMRVKIPVATGGIRKLKEKLEK